MYDCHKNWIVGRKKFVRYKKIKLWTELGGKHFKSTMTKTKTKTMARKISYKINPKCP